MGAWTNFGKGRDAVDFTPIPTRDCDRDGHREVDIGTARTECRDAHPPIPTQSPK